MGSYDINLALGGGPIHLLSTMYIYIYKYIYILLKMYELFWIVLTHQDMLCKLVRFKGDWLNQARGFTPTHSVFNESKYLQVRASCSADRCESGICFHKAESFFFQRSNTIPSTYIVLRWRQISWIWRNETKTISMDRHHEFWVRKTVLF